MDRRRLLKSIGVAIGVLVVEVQRGSIAEEKGLSPGDVITEINGSPVTNLRQFREAFKKADPKKEDADLKKDEPKKVDPKKERVIVTFDARKTHAPDLHDAILKSGYKPAPVAD